MAPETFSASSQVSCSRSIEGDFAFAHQAPEIAVGRDIVEPVVVDADVRNVGGHHLDGLAPAQVQEPLVAGGVELQEGGAELEPLRPFGPAARGVSALDSEDGGAMGGIPGLFNGQDFAGREVEEPAQLGQECLGVR